MYWVNHSFHRISEQTTFNCWKNLTLLISHKEESMEKGDEKDEHNLVESESEEYHECEYMEDLLNKPFHSCDYNYLFFHLGIIEKLLECSDSHTKSAYYTLKDELIAEKLKK